MASCCLTAQATGIVVMKESDGLICDLHVGTEGAVEPLGWVDLKPAAERPGRVWIRLDRSAEKAGKWLQDKNLLDDHVANALLSTETRRRCEVTAKGTLLLLRGVNLNPEPQPEDMVSLPVWIEANRIITARRRAILLRRYVAPKREALSQFASARKPLLDDFQRSRLRDVSDRATRLIEELDASRERAAVIQDEVSTWLAEQMNTVMQRLSTVATIFLPLSLFTGLLGINAGGMPGAESPWAFWIVCGLLAVMTVLTIWIINRLGPR